MIDEKLPQVGQQLFQKQAKFSGQKKVFMLFIFIHLWGLYTGVHFLLQGI